MATNLDSADNIGSGRMMPGTGGIVAAVEVATGRTAVSCALVRGGRLGYHLARPSALMCTTPMAPMQVNVGKGGEWLLPFLCAQYELQPHEALIGHEVLRFSVAAVTSSGR